MTLQLVAKGKGEMDYDSENDILSFHIKDREYWKSLEFDDIVLDLDKDGFIVGIEIFCPSKMFKMDKESIKRIKNWEFNTKVEKNIIKIQLRFESKLNNMVVKGTENFIREAEYPLRDSEVLCTINA